MKKFARILIFTLAGALVAAGLAVSAEAASIEAGPLTLSFDGAPPIFSGEGLCPGSVMEKLVTVTNNGCSSHSFALATSNVSGALAPKFSIKPYLGAFEIWSHSVVELASLPGGSLTVASNIAPADSVEVLLRGVVDPAAGNEYENTTVNFDLLFGTQEPDVCPVSPTPTPTPSAMPTTTVTVSAGATVIVECNNNCTGGSTTNNYNTTNNYGATATPTIVEKVVEKVRSYFGGVGYQTASPTPTPTATASSQPFVDQGEVLGAGDDTKTKGEHWLLWTIAPLLCAIFAYFVGYGIWRNLIVPILSLILVIIIALFTSGPIVPWLFWLIEIFEIILIISLMHLVFGEKGEEDDKKVKSEV